jgi:hypothetical protein
MARTTQSGAYQALPAVVDEDDGRWSTPQTAMFVTVTSAGLWALILWGLRWLLG